MIQVVAIIAIRNEEAHIGRCLRDLISNGVETVVIDHESTDRSVEIARDFLGRGLLSIERMPWSGTFVLKEQLAWKVRVAESLPHDWILHQDADEWLSPPWPQTSLVDGLASVDAAGFDTVNFDEMTFVAWPDEDFSVPDYAQRMLNYYFFGPSKLRLMRAWKRSTGANNINSGGHLLDQTTKLFPEPFILRHYMGLSSEYIYQKYAVRQFDSAELSLGWHHNEIHQRIGITRSQCLLKPSPYVKKLPTWDSLHFDKSCPAPKRYWQW